MIQIQLHSRVHKDMPPILAAGQEQVPNPSLIGKPSLALGLMEMLSTAFGMQYLGPVAGTNAQAVKWFQAVLGKSGTDVASPIIQGAVLEQLIELRALGEAQLIVLGEIRSQLGQLNKQGDLY